MTTFRRLASGGRIDRSKPVTARFDGKTLAGFAGDTLASALLANNRILVARSFKYHRPRGMMSAGIEEANGLFTLGEGATHRAQCRRHHDRSGRRSRCPLAECLALAGLRHDGGEFAAVAAVPVRILLQDLHGPVQRFVDVLRTLHPQGGGTWAAPPPWPILTATRRAMNSATCWSWAPAPPGLPRL